MEDRKAEIHRIALSSHSLLGTRLVSSFAADYYPRLELFNEKFRDRLATDLKGKVLIDLGAGTDATAMADFAHALGTSSYIAVDREVTPLIESTKKQSGDMCLHEDALYFLADQENNSASITLNAMGDVFLTMPYEYQEYLVEAIARVAGDNHIIFGVHSEEFLAKLTVFGFQKEDFGFAKLYRKKL